MNQETIEKIFGKIETKDIDYEYASFLYAIIDGKLHLGQRNTQPNKGLYGPVGGKADPSEIAQDNFLMETLGGHKKDYIANQVAAKAGLEYPNVTAIREFFEEVFYEKTYDQKDIGRVHKLGSLLDKYKERDIWLNFYLAEINRTDYQLSPRELADIKPIENLIDEQIFTIAKPGLLQIKYLEDNFADQYWFSEYNLSEQIPDVHLSRTEIYKMRPSMAGAILYKQDSKRISKKLNKF